MVHADSEHRPRPPGGERSRFVSRSKAERAASGLNDRTSVYRPRQRRAESRRRHRHVGARIRATGVARLTSTARASGP
ncbi:hypothetical protein EYR27_10970 [Xanthomonas oryzae]|nr:hypothetical protein EYR27_10970 [Xanthomonas oryzae]